jgi:hypothetical protein
MAKLNDDQRRSLKTLAHHDGCAEAALLADGFSIDNWLGWWFRGSPSCNGGALTSAGGCGPVVWMQITELGRRAIAE